MYNISSKKRRASIFFIPNQEKFFIKEMEDSIVLYTIPYYKNRGFVPKIKIKMYSNGENTIMTMRYSLYFEAELIITDDDVDLVATQTGVSQDEARKALEETGGDLAEAIMRLS